MLLQRIFYDLEEAIGDSKILGLANLDADAPLLPGLLHRKYFKFSKSAVVLLQKLAKGETFRLLMQNSHQSGAMTSRYVMTEQ